ncbi:HutD family protein [Rhizobium rhizogenes]|nr:HutD family protein [Rhizobium rhizogenes]
MKILRAADYKSMPWKNGGGVTVEIAVHPPTASMDEFDWRISMATVAQDGPFSIFSGIDRTLAIIEGNGMALAIAGHDPSPLTTGSAPLPFPADVPVDATLMDGAIVDLNIMTRRSSLKHNVQRLSGSLSVEAAPGTSLVLALDPLQVANNSDIVHLNRLDSMIIEDGSPFTIEAAKGAFFLISLQPI